jgi:carbonic anhydrase/acetyltransferase-like protein (isoleucine patch superfamily)
MSLISYRGIQPQVHPSVFLAEGTKIIGDVVIGEDSSVWFNTVIRGDVNTIRIGRRTNLQDNSVLHVTTDTASLNIGSDVTVGHNAILHGCTIENCCLIGMGSIVLDKAIVRTHSMVAAGSLVLEGFEVPEGMLVAGVPAKVKRPLTAEEKDFLATTAENYVHYMKTYQS